MSEKAIIEIESDPKSQSDEFLNQATLDYLINMKQYKNHFICFTEEEF